MRNNHSTLLLFSLFSISVFSLIGCGAKRDRLPSLNIEGYEYYVAEFSVYWGKEVKDLSISLDSNMQWPTIGLCEYAEGLQPKITLNTEYWALSDTYMREQLLYHEMGHCVLLLEHNDKELSIMNSRAIPEDLYLKNRSYLLTSLFRT